MTPVTEIDQLKQQNALLLKRLLTVSRERDELAKQLATLTAPQANEAEAR
ncbi:MAG: hypothetical protein WBC51_08345 [Vicinamibacterales bacterium]